MQIKLLSLLFIAGLTQHTQIFSSESNSVEHASYLAKIGQATHTEEDYDLYKKIIEETIEYDSEDDKNNRRLRMPCPSKSMIQRDALSVHRKSGLIVKTRHLEEAARDEYINNLILYSDGISIDACKGMILPPNELSSLLEEEKHRLHKKNSCIIS